MGSKLLELGGSSSSSSSSGWYLWWIKIELSEIFSSTYPGIHASLRLSLVRQSVKSAIQPQLRHWRLYYYCYRLAGGSRVSLQTVDWLRGLSSFRPISLYNHADWRIWIFESLGRQSRILDWIQQMTTGLEALSLLLKTLWCSGKIL